MKRMIVLLTSLLALTAASGCARVNRAPVAGAGDDWPPPINDPQIAVLSPELIEWVRFHPAIVTGGDTTPMAVQVPVRNTANRQYLLDWRMLFYDADGRELSPVMGWEMIALEPGQVARMKSNAYDTQAESYKLEVKWAR